MLELACMPERVERLIKERRHSAFLGGKKAVIFL
jgi:hypothetical protein